VRTAIAAWAISAVALGSCAVDRPLEARMAPKAKPVDAASLQGTRWRGVIDPATDARFTPWLEFVSEGRVSGYTGCNLLHGGWKGEGGAVRIGPLVTTKRACAGPEQAIEHRVVSALSERSTVAREGDKLVFTTPEGERVEFVEAR
jgi:heat shock protein HslJ